MTKVIEYSEVVKFHKLVSQVIDINFFISDFCNKILEDNLEVNEVIINENGERKYRFYKHCLKVVWNKNNDAGDSN